jgi:hypothetical protein
MRRGWRVLGWVGGVLVGLPCTAAGVLLFRAGLEDAGLWASIIGVSVTVVSLPLTLYATVLGRRAVVSSAPPAGVHVTAAGSMPTAALPLSGSASTSNGPAALRGSRSAAPPPASDGHCDQPADAVSTDPASLSTVRIQASGDRSIAAPTISSVASTDDNPPSIR